jgi:hypothetical protein
VVVVVSGQWSARSARTRRSRLKSAGDGGGAKGIGRGRGGDLFVPRRLGSKFLSVWGK